ncbi:armadillo-type protein [Dissophora ornata]|nr:hypothetical protein BGZ58_002477 [Dissophora ornata]KAI8602077.1 armadillo-type protein [Dissophora ornata]
MDQAVFQTLTDTLSTDPNARMAAELRLKELQVNPDYPLSLTRLALAHECNISQRHSAAVLLKNFVDFQWSPKSPKFRGPEPPTEIKAVVRDLILTGLSDPTNRIRISCAYVVSKIAHLDWPDSWPNLLGVLVHYLKSGSADEVHGSMRVLAEFVSKDITHVQLPSIAPVLFPELLRILSSDQIYSHATRSRCASIFRNAVEMLYTIKEEHPEAVKAYLTPIFNQWNDAFLAILNERTTKVPEIEEAEWGLKTEILKCINLSVQGFPKLTASYILPVLSAVWQDLLHLRSRYLRENVGSSSDAAGHTFQDSDGETIGFEGLLFVQLDFIQTACRRRKITQAAFVGEDGKSGITRDLIWTALTFMQMTDEQAESWNADPNQFIADEEDDSYSFNLRIAAQDVLLVLADNYEDQTFHALSLGVSQEVATSLQERSTGKPNWWKSQESSLLAVGLMAGHLCEVIKSGGPSPVDVGALFDHIVLANLIAHDFPFLQGRSFVFASQFAPILPSNLASQYVSAAVEAILKAPSAVVKVSALKALNNFNRHLDKQYVAPYQRSIIQGVAPLIEITTEETLSLIFRTLMTTSKIDEKVTAEYESILGPLALETWTKYPSDHTMSADIMDFFDTLATNQYMNPALSARSMPMFINVISPDNPDRGMAASAVDLMRSLVQGSSSPLPAGYASQFLPSIMSLLLTTDDKEILQNGQELLRIAIQKDVHQVTEWRDAESGKTGLDLLIQFIAKLLDPSRTESAALFVGDLISKLIKKGGDRISPILPDLLKAVTLRLADAKLPSFIQPLVMVFAQLCINQHETAINFLSEININQRNGLDIVLTAWLSNHMDFQGLYNQKVSAVALTRIFTSNDPRVNAIQVKGDLILSESSRRMTRSRARIAPNQYTTTTVPVKIIKLLAADLKKIGEEEGDDFGDDDDDYDDDEEDDEDEDWEGDEQNGVQGKGGKASKENKASAFLSDILDTQVQGFFENDDGLDDEDEELDPDVLADPIYQMNMKDFLVKFFRSQLNSPAFVQYVQDLSDVQKHNLSSLLGN